MEQEIKRRKIRKRKKKVSECEVSGEKAIEEGKSVKKKKKHLHQSGSVATDEESSKMTVNDKEEKVESNFSPKKKKRKHDKDHDCVVSVAANESKILKNKKHKSQNKAEDGDRVQNRLGDWGIPTESNISQNVHESVEIKKEKSSSHVKKDKKKKSKQMYSQSL